MKPQILVEREESKLGSKPAHQCAANRKKNKHSVNAKHQTGTSRNPDGEFQGIQAGESIIRSLLVPVLQSIRPLFDFGG